MHRIIFCLLFGTALLFAAPGFHTATVWKIEPSLKFDTLCLLNALSGDPYYLRYYRAEYDHFHAPLHTRGAGGIRRVEADD